MLNPIKTIRNATGRVTVRFLQKALQPLYDRVNLLSKITGTGGTKITTGATGVNIQSGGIAGGPVKLYEVQDTATGHGVYECYEQLLDGSDWDSVADATDRVVDKNSTTVEVLNLYEQYVITAGSEALRDKDRLCGWQITDDDGIKRVIGLPITGNIVRMGVTQEDAQADDKISVKLLDYKAAVVGDAFDVICLIHNGTALNEAIPRITADEYIMIVQMWGVWYCCSTFQASEDCECAAP